MQRTPVTNDHTEYQFTKPLNINLDHTQERCQSSANTTSPQSKNYNTMRKPMQNQETTFVVEGTELIREQPPPELIRLNATMAKRGICSRHEADHLIRNQMVVVDGVIAVLGMKVNPLTAKINLLPEARRTVAEKVTILLHKPPEYITGADRPGFENALSLITPDRQMGGYESERIELQQCHVDGLIPIGRLPFGVGGIQVYSQQGIVSNTLTNPDAPIDREYLVETEFECSRGRLALLRKELRPLVGSITKSRIEKTGPKSLSITLCGGGAWVITAICNRAGMTYTSMTLTRIGRIELCDQPIGEWRFLFPGERFA